MSLFKLISSSPKNNVDLFKVPHIGWNTLINTKDNRLFQNLDKEPFMYFLHSYYVVPKNEKIILSLTNYGKNKFCSAFQNENIFGCQFHPERSGKQGIRILENFLNAPLEDTTPITLNINATYGNGTLTTSITVFSII